MWSDRPPDEAIGAFIFALAALGLVIVGVAVTAWVGGRASTSSRTTTIVRTATSGGSTTLTPSNVSDRVAAGAHDYVGFGCAQCHGMGGVGGVSPDVPALDGLGTAFTVSQLTRIINHGLGESTNPTRPYMPVCHGIVSRRHVSELAAYIRAGLPPVPGADPTAVPTDQGLAVEGSALYVRDGCVNCHGPNGLGGVPEHAALGRDPVPARRECADRLSGDAPVAAGAYRTNCQMTSATR
jgi:mono/diheme cytochrome c family protein